MAEITVAGGTRIGFSANKTLEEAKSLKDNRLVLCKGHELSFNGMRVGLTDSEATFIKEKMDADLAAKVEVKVTVSPTVQDAAAPKSVNVQVQTLFDGSPIAPDSTPTCTAAVGVLSDTVTLSPSSTGLYAGNATGKNQAQTITVSASVKGVKKLVGVTVPAYHKIWYGVSPNESLGTDFSLSTTFKSVSPKANASGTYEFDFSSPNCYGYILVPSGVTLPSSMQGDNPSGQEGPLPVPFKKLANVTIGGVTYTQLRFATAQGVCKHSVTFK